MELRRKRCFDLFSNVMNSLDRLLIFLGLFLTRRRRLYEHACIRLRNIPLADERALHIMASVVLLGSEDTLKLQVSGIDVPNIQALDELPFTIN